MIVENTVTRGYTTPERPLDPPNSGSYNYCPVCGDVCNTIYKDIWGNLCGCDNCVKAVDADNVPECNTYNGVYT